jgi:hypothetical protein
MTIITGVKSPHILGRIDESKPTSETVETAKVLGLPVVSQRQIF